MNFLGWKLAFAGVGSFFLHWGVLVAVMAACVVIEFASGWLIASFPLLAKPVAWLQKWVLVIAVVAGALLVGEWIGGHDEALRCDAKAAIVNTGVDKAVKDAERNSSKRKDKFEDSKL